MRVDMGTSLSWQLDRIDDDALTDDDQPDDVCG